jgi:hypothetical protein
LMKSTRALFINIVKPWGSADNSRFVGLPNKSLS